MKLISAVLSAVCGVQFQNVLGLVPGSSFRGGSSLRRSSCGSLSADLWTELDIENLGSCHGMLHSSGVRHLVDIKALTPEDMTNMGVNAMDRQNLVRVMQDLGNAHQGDIPSTSKNQLSSCIDGAFDRPAPKRFEDVSALTNHHDFNFQVVDAEHDIYKGQLFTKDQCLQISRMAEYHAYRNLERVGVGWSNQVYTLTAQHLLCKDIPGLTSQTKHLFQMLIRELYTLFPERIRRGTICFENSGEPHLVKYSGKTKGTELHKDNSEYVYITVNAVLSATEDFNGGGTYIKAIDKTLKLEQGEMLIHLGDLEHAGADITSGVRHLLVAFLACEWEEDALNAPKLEEARDFEQ